MRRSGEFSAVLRAGARARRGSVIVHACTGLTEGTPHLGLVVSRTVGGSVVRHRVSRRLRAQLLFQLGGIPAGAGVVVRALPPAATASSAELGADLERALPAALRSAAAAGPRS
jgi:ribonuclease P protein component